MKKWIKIVAWVLFSIGILLLMHWTKESQNQQIMRAPLITIHTPKEMVFLTKNDVQQRFKLLGIPTENMKKEQINTAYIETILKKMPEVESVKVFTELDGNWSIILQIRKPIARIFNKSGESFYLDDKGKQMPLSKIYTARVLPINGNIELKNTPIAAKKIINNQALKSISKLDQLYAISNYVCNDPFLDALITQVFVEQNGDLTLTPRVGGQKILFGKILNDTIVEYRFNKLKLFYQKAIPIVGWNAYKTINLKYKQQIVCTKNE